MINFIPRFRFLPLTIFTAALLLTVKIGVIWDGFEGIVNGSISVSSAAAQQPRAADPPEAEMPSAETGEAAAGAGEAETEKPVSRYISEDPTLLTQAEIDILQQLAERREILSGQERDFEMQVGLMQAAEARIDKKVRELKELQEIIEKLILTYDDQQNTRMGSLVKIYENMKAKEAALIFEELDMNTLLLVVERMSERKLAPIMAEMNPTKARDVTVELSRLRQLPEMGS